MTSLFTALSALKAHQSWIDVIGNNLANTNTPGYKSSTATFASQLSQTLRYATQPGSSVGGRNPVQIGHGVQLSDIGRHFGQGALAVTGRTFDLALDGHGFFALSNGALTAYTRVGSFGLDAENNLVDRATGLSVLGADRQPIELDVDALFPPSATSSLALQGNLPSVVSGPLQEELASVTALSEGAQAVLTGTATEPFAVPAGETWSMTLSVSGGPPQTVSVTGTGAPLTAADLATAIDALDEIGASVVGGAVQVTSDRTGQTVTLQANAGAPGQDLTALLGLSTSLVSGSQSAVTAGTDLNLLPGNAVDYVNGDQIEVTGVDNDGTPIAATFTYGTDGTTVGELVSFLDGLYGDATVALGADGELMLTATTAGESSLSLSLSDGSGGGQTGATDWADYALSVTTQGTGPDVVTTSAEVYDRAGTAHTLSLDFERQQDGTWTVTPSLPEGEGQVTSPPIQGITFDDAGRPVGLSGVPSQVTVLFDGQSASQTLELDLGTDGNLEGLTQFGTEATVWADNVDGYGVGELVNLTVGAGGEVEGYYSNGQVQELARLGIATFSNAAGLAALGDNLFQQSANSGTAVMGQGDVGAAGGIVQGALESSNVDTAEQFVRLIEAQRGFQANARVVSTQDEILAELVNIL